MNTRATAPPVGDDRRSVAPTSARPPTPEHGVLFCRRDLVVSWMSPRLLARVGPVQRLDAIASPGDVEGLNDAAHRVLGRPGAVEAVEITLTGLGGAAPPVLVMLESLIDRAAGQDLLVSVHGRGAAALSTRPDPPWTGLDKLTGLQDRWQLDAWVAAAAERSSAEQTSVVMLLDLDRLKVVNDSLGHAAGDRVLSEVGRRLRSSVGADGKVARFGGDEFVIVAAHLPGEHDGATLARRVLAALRAPILVGEQSHVVTASIGLVYLDGGAVAAAEVLRNADTAMYQAKAAGGDRFVAFDEVMATRALRRFDTEGELRRAIEAEQFTLHYQPQVSLQTGRIAGTEALLRWNHPESGLVFPGAFVGIAEETGLIVELGDWALAQALADAHEFQRRSRNGEPITVSVNVSAVQLGDPTFPDRVEMALARSGVDPAILILEVTESALVGDDPHAIRSFARLKEVGVGVAVDDFGTGYSSIAYLGRFPVDEVKIDRAFILEMTHERGRAVMDGICRLAKSLDLKIVVEGIEETSPLEALRAAGCDLIQGYLVAKAMPARDFVKALGADRGRALR